MTSLSKTEVGIVSRLTYEEKDIVTAKELDSYLPPRFLYRNQLVYSLKKKRILIPIKSGVYIFVPLDAVPTGRRVSEFLIPPVFFPQNDYYIGYSTMFNYYNFTDQQFQTVYVLNPRISRAIFSEAHAHSTVPSAAIRFPISSGRIPWGSLKATMPSCATRLITE